MDVPRRGVPGLRGVPDTYWGISLWDGGREAIKLSVIKLDQTTRRGRVLVYMSHMTIPWE